MTIRGERRRGERREGEVLVTVDGAPLDWRSSLVVRNHSPTGPAWGGGDVSSRRLLGAHLPASFPERRETVAGECLGCQTQFAVDVRLPLPASCPDCGGDVLARADLEVPEPPGRPPFNALRIRRTKP